MVDNFPFAFVERLHELFLLCIACGNELQAKIEPLALVFVEKNVTGRDKGTKPMSNHHFSRCDQLQRAFDEIDWKP